jgi:thymidylate synthase (FAD)
MAFLSLRTHEPTAERVSYPLWEIDNAARQVEAVFAEKMPLTHRAFCENGRTGSRDSRNGKSSGISM